jgi:hypothetical protein
MRRLVFLTSVLAATLLSGCGGRAGDMTAGIPSGADFARNYVHEPGMLPTGPFRRPQVSMALGAVGRGQPGMSAVMMPPGMRRRALR